MAQTDGLTGKAVNASISGTAINITSLKPKVSMAFADATDSGDYDPVTGNLYKSQEAGDTQIELEIAGNYDKNTTSSLITQKLQSPGSGPWAIIGKLDASTTLISGNFDLTDVSFDMTVPGAAMISFTATAKSNGKYVLN